MQKKAPELHQVNHVVLASLPPDQVEVELCRADEIAVRRGLSAEIDDMWCYVGKKAHQHWLWHAIDPHMGQLLAYVFGRRQDEVFLRLKALLEPFGITAVLPRRLGSDERHVDAEKHLVGKEHMQRIERKHITLRTLKHLPRRKR